MEGGRARSKGPFRLQCGWGVAFSWELREVIEELGARERGDLL